MWLKPNSLNLQEEVDRAGKKTGKYILSWTEYYKHPVGYTAPDHKWRSIPSEGIQFIRDHFKDK